MGMNYEVEITNLWKQSQKHHVRITTASGESQIDLMILSLVSSLVSGIVGSFNTPESLLHLLDIDIILPDFSYRVVKILKDYLEGREEITYVNINVYNELQELRKVLGFNAFPSLTRIKEESNDMNMNIKRGEVKVKVEPSEKGETDSLPTRMPRHPFTTTHLSTPTPENHSKDKLPRPSSSPRERKNSQDGSDNRYKFPHGPKAFIQELRKREERDKKMSQARKTRRDCELRCRMCGKEGHSSNKCRGYCYHCGKGGHFTSKCWYPPAF